MEKFIILDEKNNYKDYVMIILTENDVENEKYFSGFGYEFLVLPSKYKNINSTYLNNIRMLPEIRNGEIIYV